MEDLERHESVQMGSGVADDKDAGLIHIFHTMLRQLPGRSWLCSCEIVKARGSRVPEVAGIN